MAVLTLYQTTIGKKVIMAVTGLILVGYTIVHMYGNLHTFEGAAALNSYGAFLREFGYPAVGNEQALWLIRAVLFVSAVLHIWAAVRLTQTDLAGRPAGYRTWRSVNASLPARTMKYSGVLLAVFIVYHILHLTTGTVHADFRYGDIYHNVLVAFQNPLVTLIYVLAMAMLGFHLFHGVWSMFQTLGLNNRGRTRFWGTLAVIVAVVVSVGFVTVPLAVLIGLVR